jgi:hypothetical protein
MANTGSLHYERVVPKFLQAYIKANPSCVCCSFVGVVGVEFCHSLPPSSLCYALILQRPKRCKSRPVMRKRRLGWRIGPIAMMRHHKLPTPTSTVLNCITNWSRESMWRYAVCRNLFLVCFLVRLVLSLVSVIASLTPLISVCTLTSACPMRLTHSPVVVTMCRSLLDFFIGPRHLSLLLFSFVSLSLSLSLSLFHSHKYIHTYTLTHRRPRPLFVL